MSRGRGNLIFFVQAEVTLEIKVLTNEVGQIILFATMVDEQT